jgi:hypothetical protein
MSRGDLFVRRFSLASLVAVAALIAAPGGASAAATIGATFPSPSSACGTNVTVLQTSSPASQYAAASPGVITSWTFQAGSTAPANLKLKIGRSAGGANFLIVGESPEKHPSANTSNTYSDIQIPVQAGDMIGYWAEGPTSFCGRLVSEYLFRSRAGDQLPGTTQPYGSESSGFQIDFSARLEPDCDNDGLGDESQDADLTACHSNAFTFAGLTRNKKKGTATLKVNVPEPGELIGSGNGAKVAAAGATISKAVTAGTAQLLIKAKGKKKRKLNETGKVKLSVAVTYTPTGGKPNTQSVKVKLKKTL